MFVLCSASSTTLFGLFVTDLPVLSSSPNSTRARNPCRIVSGESEGEKPKGEPCHGWDGKPETIGGSGKEGRKGLRRSAALSKSALVRSDLNLLLRRIHKPS